MKRLTDKLEEIIINIITKLDKDHANYQELYRNYYGKEDETARHIYNSKVKLCNQINREMMEKNEL